MDIIKLTAGVGEVCSGVQSTSCIPGCGAPRQYCKVLASEFPILQFLSGTCSVSSDSTYDG